MICILCKRNLSDSYFTRNKRNKSRKELDWYCKECKMIKKREYCRSLEGIIQTIYDSQKLSCKIRNHPLPSYSKKEFKQWVLSNKDFLTQYQKWIDSNYIRDEKPSIDRLNDFESYSFTNIRVCSYKDNVSKGHKDRTKGIGTQGLCCKAVSQYDLNNNLIRTYIPAAEAQRYVGIPHQNISKVCCGKRHTAGGYIWAFTNESVTTIS